MWLGQAPKVDYIKERCHGEFRWWYEYSGGKLTDWGAHHVDIAQWAIGMENSGPNRIEVVYAEHPVEFRGGFPTVDDRYNTATAFHGPLPLRQRRRASSSATTPRTGSPSRARRASSSSAAAD